MEGTQDIQLVGSVLTILFLLACAVGFYFMRDRRDKGTKRGAS